MAAPTPLVRMRSETRELTEQTQHEVHKVIVSGTKDGGSHCLQKRQDRVVLPPAALPPYASVLVRWPTRTQ